MKTPVLLLGSISTFCLLLFAACSDHKEKRNVATFTRADSLTGRYLDLQDSVVLSWNVMINDDNQKINAMAKLIQELKKSNQFSPEQLSDFEERLLKLKEMRYTQKTLSDAERIAEYDFASNSLVSELVTMAQEQADFASNTTIQQLVDQIQAADQRVAIYRAEYDDAVKKYNQFIEEHPAFIKEISNKDSITKKPLFQVASE